MVLYHTIACPHPIAGKTYGIAGQSFDSHGNTMESVFIPDISCDRDMVSSLARLCRDGQLALEQLHDVVYDALE